MSVTITYKNNRQITTYVADYATARQIQRQHDVRKVVDRSGQRV